VRYRERYEITKTEGALPVAHNGTTHDLQPAHTLHMPPLSVIDEPAYDVGESHAAGSEGGASSVLVYGVRTEAWRLRTAGGWCLTTRECELLFRCQRESRYELLPYEPTRQPKPVGNNSNVRGTCRTAWKSGNLLIKCATLNCFYYLLNLRAHVRWVPVTTAWRVIWLRMEERPPAMEDSCEYIE
jgi:hypothetical protein